MRILFRMCMALVLIMLAISFFTYHYVQPINHSLLAILSDAQKLQVYDRNNQPLSVSYQNRWNTYDNLALYQIPPLIVQAFISSEDRHFYQHNGIDWNARMMALWQNVNAHHTVRGASTITEQVVRLIHPRQRTLWSKWLESFEAISLERHFNKADILEFYLNQVPYAANRRGIVQASRYYFNRDIATLTPKEMLALAVLARAPSSYDLYKNPNKINNAIDRLAFLLYQQQQLSSTQLKIISQQTFELQAPQLPINAFHFVNFVRTHAHNGSNTQLHTTLDANIQEKIQMIVDQRVRNLQTRGVHNAAVLIVDHQHGDILAWVVAGANSGVTPHPFPSYKIDAVTVTRQPGSALKPLLYATALDLGWSPSTIIDDSPMSEAIGTGLHRFKNYSNVFYGKISLREALGNSLNIPALRTILFVGTARYLSVLHQLGFESLTHDHDFYDEGLALGNGEVTLFELVQAYTTLANRGVFRPLNFLLDNEQPVTEKRVFSEEAASLISNILSDPWARRLEFGYNSVLNLPVQTAVKTGTSTDYQDAWVVGYNYRYVVGIWMGNLNRTPMDGITGSTGPALVMRSVFAELNKHHTTSPLFLSPKLIREDVCIGVDQNKSTCTLRTEYFKPGTQLMNTAAVEIPIKLILPTEGLQIAIDPRIPQEKQKIAFQLQGITKDETIEWILNNNKIATTQQNHYLWPLTKGKFKLKIIVYKNNKRRITLPETHFLVK